MSEITVGTHTVSVVPQPVPYLEDRLGKYLGKLADIGEKIDAESIIGLLGENVYEVLVTLVPELGERMPAYEFNGYPSREAYEQRGERTKESLGKAYTFPQLVDAFKTIVAVNQFNELERVMGWAGKALMKAADSLGVDKEKIGEAVEKALTESSTSLSANGASGSTKRSETSPT